MYPRTEKNFFFFRENFPASVFILFLTHFCTSFSQKNKPGKIIVLYDEDETIAPRVATTFIQREVDNIFMLSGGQLK